MSNNSSSSSTSCAPALPQNSNSERINSNMEKKTILFIGNYRATIPLIHEFKNLGFKIIVGVTDAPERGYMASRFVTEKWLHPNPDDEPDQFVDELNLFLSARKDITFVMPVAEDMLVLIQSNLSKLVRPGAFVMIESDLIDLCLDKMRILDFADLTGVKQAPYKIVTDYPSLLNSAEKIGFPIALRPIQSSLKFGSRKALLCENIDELKRCLPSWPEDHMKLILQKLFFGRRHNLYFAARDGEIFRLLETVADRTDHADGTGLAVMGRTIEISPALRHDTEMLIKKMNYSGIGCAQFLVCEKNKSHSFLEINPRIAGNHMLPTKAGLSLGPLFVALTKNINFSNLNSTDMIIAEPGITYVWTYGDLGGCLREWKNGRINFISALKWGMLAIKDAAFADMHMTWSWHDPKPAFSSYGDRVHGFIRNKLNASSLKASNQVK